MNILLIEDSPSDAQQTKQFLKETGFDFNVQQAETLKEALQQLKQQSFDLVISGLTLPDSRGIATAASILKHFPGIQLLIIAGVFNLTIRENVLNLGAKEYLRKANVNADVLKAAIGPIASPAVSC